MADAECSYNQMLLEHPNQDGAWQCNFPAPEGNYDRPTDQSTNRPTTIFRCEATKTYFVHTYVCPMSKLLCERAYHSWEQLFHT